MLRKLLPILNIKLLRMVYCALFYSQINYGIIFWGSSASIINVFIIQNTTVRIVLRLGPRSACREGFKKIWVYSQFLVHIFMH
jgi:hypothetical protein